MRKKIKGRDKQQEKLYMLAQDLMDSVSGGGFRAMHDFHLVQVVSKTQGTPVAVIDLVAAQGFCMAESMRYKREYYFAKKWRLDKRLMVLTLTAAALPWDKCDFRPTTVVVGVGAHVSAVPETCMAVGYLAGHLSVMRAYRREEELVDADMTRRTERVRRSGRMIILAVVRNYSGATARGWWERDRIWELIIPVVKRRRTR